MTKRSAIRRVRADACREDAPQLNVIRGGWDPDEAFERSAKRRQRSPEPSPASTESGRDHSYVKNVQARTDGQARLMEAIDRSDIVLALGPAGTGKTYLAISKAVEALRSGRTGRIVLCRPAVEAGESIGFLPGDMEEKLAPYLRPLYDALADRMAPRQIRQMIADGLIEIAPVGFMRGRTLNNAFVVIDEAQNCTYVQLKMLLTRLGWNSKMVVTGDPAQSDLLPELSGLSSAAARLEAMEGGPSVVRLDAHDVVRHPLVARMLGAL